MRDGEHDAYANIAVWYDVEHDAVTEDIECYQVLLASVAGARASVLELGSGSGRVAAALALAGYTVTGIEPSEAMRARGAKRLAALPERVARRVRQVAGTAGAPGLESGQHFDAALIGCNTIAHLTSREERARALDVARGHLRPGGVLILDLDLAGPRRMAETIGQVWYSGLWPVPDSPLTLCHCSVATAGAEPGTLRLTHFYDTWEPGGPVCRTASTMTLALLSQGEVALALLHAGFSISALYGSYDEAV
ncbi:MAG: class I SAM-dependent methyltransferase [Ktedonobacterales bacterium]|nr:class I SAM-dependent methyltransferase [Ktedonobacterales bacterium]